MRLLHTKNLRVTYFVSGKTPRTYAILSHTWEEEEVTLEDMEKGNSESKKGYQKLKKSCNRALKDGYEWIWIDTCCIDKRNSAELSEAINSMFKYYSHSAVCYAYLTNVRSIDGLKSATWFERGWTLQELLAPRHVIFFDSDWGELGTKRDFSYQISSRTGIPEDVLLGKSIYSCNVGQRMSWASQRQTTREEDIAYCLLGLFDIQMVPIYGEGAEQAFLRLQEEILRRSADHTLFIWTPKHDPNNQGLLATSPKAFCGHPECFDWMMLEHRTEHSSFDAYAFMRRQSNRISKRVTAPDANTDREKFVSVEDSEHLATSSLGQSGLQVSLLSHIQDGSEVSNMLGVEHKLICFDIVVDGTDSQDPIILTLIRDMNIENFNGLVPNRLGMWRRKDWKTAGASYVISPVGLSYERGPVALSQIKTPVHYSGLPVTFTFDGKQSEDAISQLLFVEPIGDLRIYSKPPKSFQCFGGLMSFQHSCNQCGRLKYVLSFGGHGRVVYQPWCDIGYSDESTTEAFQEAYESNKRRSARFSDRASMPTMRCKMRLSAQVDFGTNENCYVIKVRSMPEKVYGEGQKNKS